MKRVVRVCEIAVSRSPATRDHVGPILRCPNEGISLCLRPQIGSEANWNETRFGGDARCAEVAVSTCHARTGSPVIVTEARSRVVCPARHIAGSNNLVR